MSLLTFLGPILSTFRSLLESSGAKTTSNLQESVMHQVIEVVLYDPTQRQCIVSKPYTLKDAGGTSLIRFGMFMILKIY